MPRTPLRSRDCTSDGLTVPGGAATRFGASASDARAPSKEESMPVDPSKALGAKLPEGKSSYDADKVITSFIRDFVEW